MIKYHAKITSIGPHVAAFKEEGILVLFGANAPEELAEFSILHDGARLLAPLAVGDEVHIDAHAFRVLAIGHIANQNLANLGHLILKFNGQATPELPGDVCVEAGEIPDIQIGTVVVLQGPDSE
ncbi:MAG: PTS glucitol/sorbitol transporter subunit IIA [Chloroflexi bacterium]|jgi:PTS system glucitol/sorbitol-specific IIA component|nr:PTS glucitol/sorbitol transporter subunit IIA [Anaerolineaceae bacterium]NMB90368.1 PTS glucitol/sorbitol transporter subunit IIA [Chloroflexota bacterium]